MFENKQGINDQVLGTVRQDFSRDVGEESVASEVAVREFRRRELTDDEAPILLQTADGAIQLRIDPMVAKRWAEIQWRDFLSRTPGVIRGGSYCGKSFLPGYVNSYIAANDLTLQVEQLPNDDGTECVLTAEPSKIKARLHLEWRLSQQEVEFGSDDLTKDVNGCHGACRLGLG